MKKGYGFLIIAAGAILFAATGHPSCFFLALSGVFVIIFGSGSDAPPPPEDPEDPEEWVDYDTAATG